MNSGLCCTEEKQKSDVLLSKDEVETLFMNMIVFKGSWRNHLDFLNNLDENVSWRNTQIPLVRELKRKDAEHDLQAVCWDSEEASI